jgi:hypothetical protein
MSNIFTEGGLINHVTSLGSQVVLGEFEDTASELMSGRYLDHQSTFRWLGLISMILCFCAASTYSLSPQFRLHPGPIMKIIFYFQGIACLTLSLWFTDPREWVMQNGVDQFLLKVDAFD